MDEVDVFEGLDVLEKEVMAKSRIRKEKKKNANRLRQLRERCELLKKKKEELEEKLECELDEDIETVASMWKSRLNQCLLTYRLTGISASSLGPTSRLIRFDTSFEGQFHEPYFLELIETQSMTTHHHTIPAFVPLKQLTERYLPDDLLVFLRQISDHLVAFVRRREDLKRAQEILQTRGYLLGDMSYTLAVDLVEFHIKEDTLTSVALDVTLGFNDLLHLTPSTASIKALGETTEDLEHVKGWEKLLTSGPPSESLHILCPEREEETTDQAENSMSDSE